MDWQQESMARTELRDESLRWGRQAVVRRRDERRDQYGRGDQCTARVCAFGFRPDHVVHGKRLESQCKVSARLGCEGVASSLSDVFPEERCKVDDDGGSGSLVGHEQDGGKDCLGEFTRRCFRKFWREQGSEIVCWHYERQRTSECRKMQRDHDM